MLFAMIRGPKLTKQRLFDDWCNPPPFPKKVSMKAPKLTAVEGNPTLDSQTKHINKHIWVNWMNAMLSAMIRGPKLTKQGLFEDWCTPPPSPKRVSTEASKPTAVDGKPTRCFPNQAHQWTHMSLLDECYAFCCDKGTKTHQAVAVWRLMESSPLSQKSLNGGT